MTRPVAIERQAARVVLVADARVLLQHGFDPGRPDERDVVAEQADRHERDDQ